MTRMTRMTGPGGGALGLIVPIRDALRRALGERRPASAADGPGRRLSVAGFAFSPARRILLIRKSRPAWQAGLLNGIGGRVEAGESPLDAMRREAEEEAGLSEADWTAVAILASPGREVHFFRATLGDDAFDGATARTDEPLVRLAMADFPGARVVPNLSFLVPLALDDTGIAKPVRLVDERPRIE